MDRVIRFGFFDNLKVLFLPQVRRNAVLRELAKHLDDPRYGSIYYFPGNSFVYYESTRGRAHTPLVGGKNA